MWTRESQPPWFANSEFSVRQADLGQWPGSLHDNLRLARSAVQQRKGVDQHRALLLLHITYCQTICDLARIGMQELFKLRQPLSFPAEQEECLQTVQATCFGSYLAVLSLLQEVLKHGTESLADTWPCVVAHDAVRVFIHYVTSILGSAGRYSDSDVTSGVQSASRVIIQALKRMIPVLALVKHSGCETTHMTVLEMSILSSF